MPSRPRRFETLVDPMRERVQVAGLKPLRIGSPIDQPLLHDPHQLVGLIARVIVQVHIGVLNIVEPIQPQ